MLQRKSAERTAYFLLDMGQSNRMKRRGREAEVWEMHASGNRLRRRFLLGVALYHY
jgi:hypothetical protein